MPTPRIYTQLANHAWVLEQLKTKSMKKLAEEVGCAPSSVRWIVERFFSTEDKKLIKYERKPHRNKKSSQV